MAPPTWASRERPILELVSELEWEPAAKQVLVCRQVAAKLALPAREVGVAMRALWDSGYIKGALIGSGEDRVIAPVRLLERGRREIGQWPPDAALGAFLQ